ncbi:Pyoverdine/dityrosine biosynthesis protein-domain-containing protein [Amylocarpus encephaloides]|uniref:Pyoverdine/dityrosine biosynthesis protein-domain-containing protein n=1 Tax=Amylocarpus encephaloides TaxID=45428 RepID=A0A9P7YHQ1_9HELO|nr:Pyoverdine/dityrosine biosynthesis protein-domain-containing protein [Amylocarpus encephaloides]
MEQLVYSCVEQEFPIHLVLPAFPFKSPNRVHKVLGSLPDMGEELALARLEGLCAQIDEVYLGTTLSIISDGLVYSDLLKVSEEDVWNYGAELRHLAAKKFPRISFTRLSKLVSKECPEPQSLETYLANASWYRNELVKNNLPKDFDVKQELKQINTLMTYRGYIKFLATDLKHEQSRQGKSKSQVKKMNEKVAKRMIERGAAFALAAQKAFPTSIRISIHRSESRYKLPISLFSGGESYTTPWHCVCALELDGSWRYANKHVFAGDPEYDLMYQNDRPSYYRRRSELYSWGGYEVDMTPIYPCGILVSPGKSNVNRSMDNIDMMKVRGLSEYNSPIVLRGFENTTELSLFQSKAREMGSVMPWKFGEVLVVKDAGNENGGLNNVLSAEPMPMHFDGLFKTELMKDESGEERFVPRPPKFQWFTVATPAPQSCGLTLIASSRILLSLLPKPYTSEQLQELTWTVSTTAFNNSKISKLPLIETHPSLGSPCLRYHEPWPVTRTKFDATDVHIDDMSREESKILTNTIDRLLYDRRVCYYHEWVEGDLILSDNINMMHTRTGFIPGAPRELWRIHID